MPQNQWRGLGYHGIPAHVGVGGGVTAVLDGEGAEAYGVMFAQDIERLRRIARAASDFGYEQHVVGECVFGYPVGEAFVVKVGGQEVYCRRRGVPDVLEVR